MAPPGVHLRLHSIGSNKMKVFIRRGILHLEGKIVEAGNRVERIIGAPIAEVPLEGLKQAAAKGGGFLCASRWRHLLQRIHLCGISGIQQGGWCKEE